VSPRSLGLVMIARNEAANLARSLAPLAGLFDEAVVVDTGSTDQTADLARRMGARVVELAWQNDFAAARNRSLEEARADYLFWLDADNAIPPEAVAALRQALNQNRGPFIGWGTEVLEPRGERLLQKRLFPRHKEVRFQGRVHEQLVHPAGWPFVYLGLEISHWGYADPESARAKGQRNLELLLEELDRLPRDFYLLYQAGKTLLQLNRLSEADDYLGRASASAEGLAQNPELFSHAWVLWALTAERLGRGGAAEERLAGSPARTLPRAGQGLVAFHRARLAARRRAWAEALGHLDRLDGLGLDFLTLDLDARRIRFTAALLRARASRALERPERAVRSYERAIGLEPGNPAPYRELAGFLLDSGQPQAARGVLERLLAARPGDRFGLELLRKISGRP